MQVIQHVQIVYKLYSQRYTKHVQIAYKSCVGAGSFSSDDGPVHTGASRRAPCRPLGAALLADLVGPSCKYKSHTNHIQRYTTHVQTVYKSYTEIYTTHVRATTVRCTRVRPVGRPVGRWAQPSLPTWSARVVSTNRIQVIYRDIQHMYTSYPNHR